MARPKTKDGKRINFYIDAALLDRFHEYCEEVGQNQTVAVERILKAFLDDYDKKKVVDR